MRIDYAIPNSGKPGLFGGISSQNFPLKFVLFEQKPGCLHFPIAHKLFMDYNVSVKGQTVPLSILFMEVIYHA